MPDPNPVEIEDDGDDLGAALEKNWDAAAESTTSAPAEDAAPASAEAPSLPSEAPVDAGRARNPDGTFAKTAKEQAAAAAAPAQSAAPAPEFKVPEKWPADVRAKLSQIHAVNPEHAQFLVEQYTTMRAISAQHQAKASEHLRTYEQYLAPTRNDRALRGIDDGTHIKHLLAADKFMRDNPAGGIKFLAQQYGIDLGKINEPQGGEAEIPAWAQELQRQVQEQRQLVVQQSRGMEQQQLKAAGDWIDSFAGQKDASGKPLYPYFDEVLPQLVDAVHYQMQSGQQVDVAKAYQTAVRLNETVWLKAERARSEDAKKAAEAQRLRDIEDAKRASVSVRGSSAGTSDAAPDDLGEALSRNYDKFFS